MCYNYVCTCPFLLDSMQFNLFSGYVVTRRNFKMGKYFSISYYKKSRSSLINFCCCAKFDMDCGICNSLDGLMVVIQFTSTQSKQNRGETCNIGKSPTRMESYKILCHTLFCYNKPEQVFARCF